MSTSIQAFEPPHAVEISVEGLYGEFNHRIEFPADDEFCIIYGPNGVGKTRVFAIFEYMMNLDALSLARQPFDSSCVIFDSGHRLLALRTPGENPLATEIKIELWLGRRRIATHTPAVRKRRIGRTPEYWEVHSEHWSRIGVDRWVDDRDGEIVPTSVLQSRYGYPIDEPPAELASFLAAAPVHHIQTQRLTAEKIAPRRPTRINRDDADDTTTTVQRYAKDLSDRLGDALAVNSRTSQTLDRTFPRRLLDERATGMSENEIRDEYNKQSELRSRLAKINLSDPEPDLPLPVRELEEWERIVLTKYLQDTKDKLDTFAQILTKVELLEEIVNRRFLRNRISVNSSEGLSILTPNGDSIRLTDLSSGEQHELILLYDLLFRAERGSTVLIDEPEISLHVAWQRAFMGDMLRICKVSDIRMIVATHSPQIINTWWDRTQRLGPELANPGYSEDSGTGEG